MFKIGEIAIYIDESHPDDDPRLADFHKEEVKITGPSFHRDRWGTTYPVEWPDGVRGKCCESSLRKKKPPKKEKQKPRKVILGRWQDVEEWTGWNPTKVTI